MLSQISVELQTSEVSAAALQPVLQMIQDCTLDEYQTHIFPLIRNLYQAPKSVQVSLILVDQRGLFKLHHSFKRRLNILRFFSDSKKGDRYFAGKCRYFD